MKIGTRLITYLVVTLILVMSVHAVVNVFEGTRGLRQEVHRFARKIARIAAEEASVRLRQGDPKGLGHLLATLSRMEGVLDLVIQSPRGEVISRVHAPREGAPPDSAFGKAPGVPPEGAGGETRWAGLRAYEYTLPVQSARGEPAFAVRVIMDLTFIEHHNARARWSNIATIAVMTLLLAVLFFFFTRKSVVFPLQELTRAVGAFREGRWDQRIHLPKDDEIGMLASEFNNMAEEIGRANRRLVLEHEQQRAIVQSLREGVVVLAPSGEVIFWNPAALKLAGLAGEEADGRETARNLSEFINASGERLRDSLKKISRGALDEAVLRPFDCPSPDGKTRRLRANARKLMDGPMTGGIIIVLEDVTEQEALSHQMMRAERLASLGHFVSGIAHELGTPLNIVNGRVQQALGRLGADHPAREKLVPIVDQIDRIAGLVRRLLEFARGGRIQTSAVDLNAEISGVLSLLEAMRKEAGVELRLELGESLPPLYGDSDQIQQLVMNLCVNALQAMPEGGRLTVSTRCEGGGILLSFRDTGHGIDPLIQDRIFDPFFTTKDVGRGTGLGLSVCHRIVEDHGGSIQVSSRPGEGSAFHVRFPVAKQEVAHEQPLA